MGRRDDDDLDDDEGGARVRAADADAALRFGVSLLLSLLLAAPVLYAGYEGHEPLDATLVHYLMCFVVARVGVGVVGAVYGGYRRAASVDPSAVPGPMSESR